MKRVAFVVQRAGREVNGGAESLCLGIAARMTEHWKVELLTTCALDYMTWENYYPAGAEQIDGVTVRRFPVEEPRNIESFRRLCNRLEDRLRSASIDEGEEWMRAQGPRSPELLDFMKSHRESYDAFVFFTYLYYTSYFGLPLVSDRSILVPLAHDEWPIYLKIWDVFFQTPKSFVFNTPEEREFLCQRFPNISFKGPVAGVAIDCPQDINPERFRDKYGIRDRYLLYIGRVDPCKGCNQLFNHFLRLRLSESLPRYLVLLGKPIMPIPKHPDIISLGFVDEHTKWDALAGCDLLIMPSPYESLSMVLLEAWAVGRPVLVNAGCDVLVGQCRRAQGGIWYTNAEEFRAAIGQMDLSTGTLLGQQGKRFVEQEYSWKNIERAYLDAI
jgi:glycosyltransferase involved in cell wall biosynthesis